MTDENCPATDSVLREYIKFHADFLRGVLNEWETERTDNAAAHVLEQVGMLARYGRPEFLADLMQEDGVQALAEAGLRHLASLENLAHRPTNTYDETFDLALFADGLFTALLVGQRVMQSCPDRDHANRVCSAAICCLDPFFCMMTEHPDFTE